MAQFTWDGFDRAVKFAQVFLVPAVVFVAYRFTDMSDKVEGLTDNVGRLTYQMETLISRDIPSRSEVVKDIRLNNQSLRQDLIDMIRDRTAQRFTREDWERERARLIELIDERLKGRKE